MPGMLSYSLNVCMSLLQSRQFRNKVSYACIVFFKKKKKLVAEERTTTMSSLHFLYVNSKLRRQHTRRRWQPPSVHL